MNITHISDLDELAAMAIRLGRELAGMAEAIGLGGTSQQPPIVSGALRRLAERNPFDPRNEPSLEALRGVLEAGLKSEVIRMERRFYETRHDEFGQDGEIRECPIYSARGEELLALQKTFTGFLAAREATLDRLAAERALRQLLGA